VPLLIRLPGSTVPSAVTRQTDVPNHFLRVYVEYGYPGGAPADEEVPTRGVEREVIPVGRGPFQNDRRLVRREDRVKGLEIGADDYLPKPFSFEEPLARVRSLTDIGPGGIVYANSKTLKAIPVPSYMSWDLCAAYNDDTPGTRIKETKGCSLALGMNNLFNRMPAAAPQAYTDNNADVSTYSPIGRRDGSAQVLAL
jgi:hypothetical protein